MPAEPRGPPNSYSKDLASTVALGEAASLEAAAAAAALGAPRAAEELRVRRRVTDSVIVGGERETSWGRGGRDVRGAAARSPERAAPFDERRAGVTHLARAATAALLRLLARSPARGNLLPRLVSVLALLVSRLRAARPHRTKRVRPSRGTSHASCVAAAAPLSPAPSSRCACPTRLLQ